MCLKNDPKCIEKIKASGKKKFVCYKVLDQRYDTLYSPIYSMAWKAGLNVSNSNSRVEIAYKSEKNVKRGIHVYRGKKSIPIWLFSRVKVKVTGKIEDLLAANKNEMVFKQVTLSKAEYAKAVKH